MIKFYTCDIYQPALSQHPPHPEEEAIVRTGRKCEIDILDHTGSTSFQIKKESSKPVKTRKFWGYKKKTVEMRYSSFFEVD